MNASAAHDSDATVLAPIEQRLKRLRRIWLAMRGGGDRSFVGGPRNKLPGGGTTASGWRDYAPGDDFRHVDWRLCARRDELLTRTFEGDEDRHVYLWVDCSRSMSLGRPEKLRLARRIAEALGYCVLAGLDRLSVTAFADGLVADSGLLRHPTRVARLLRFVDTLLPQGDRTDLAQAATAWVRLGRRPGPVVVISDLYDEGGFLGGFDLLRQRGYEPRVVQIVDLRAAEPSVLGDVELVDVEGGASHRAVATQRDARRYRALFEEFMGSVRRYAAGHGLRCVQLPSDMPEDEALARVLGGGACQPGSLVAGAAADLFARGVDGRVHGPAR